MMHKNDIQGEDVPKFVFSSKHPKQVLSKETLKTSQLVGEGKPKEDVVIKEQLVVNVVQPQIQDDCKETKFVTHSEVRNTQTPVQETILTRSTPKAPEANTEFILTNAHKDASSSLENVIE